MARRAFFANVGLAEYYVLIAVGPQFLEPLYLARGFAFDPELLARSAEVGDLAALDRVFESVLIHECEHEDLVRMDVRRDARN